MQLSESPHSPDSSDPRSSTHHLRQNLLAALGRGWAPELLDAAIRDPETGVSRMEVAPIHRAWLKGMLVDLRREGLSADALPAQVELPAGIWTNLIPRFCANLVAVLRDELPAEQLFEAAPAAVAAALGEALAVPSPLEARLNKTLRLLHRKAGPEAHLLDGLLASPGSHLAHLLGEAADPSRLTALRVQGAGAAHPGYDRARFIELDPLGRMSAEPREPFDLVALAGGFDIDAHRLRMTEAMRWVRSGTVALFLAPSATHPWALTLLGAFGTRFGLDPDRWRDSLGALGWTELHPLHETEENPEWVLFLGELRQALTLTPEPLVADTTEPVHAAPGFASKETAPPVAELNTPAQAFPAAAAASTTAPRPAPPRQGEDLRELLEADLTLTLQDILHVPREDLDLDQDLTDLGMDSIMAGELAAKLSHAFGVKIAPTLFFSSNTAQKIITTLITDFGSALRGHYEIGDPSPAAPATAPVPMAADLLPSDSITAPISTSAETSKGPANSTEEALREALLTDLAVLIEEVLHIAPADLDLDEDLTDLGMDSIMAGEFAAKLGHALNVKIAPTFFFTSNTALKILATLSKEYGEALLAYYGPELQFETAVSPTSKAQPETPTGASSSEPTTDHTVALPSNPTEQNPPIAVIGMAGSFSGAANPDELWENLLAGRESLSPLPEARWRHLGRPAFSEKAAGLRAGVIPYAETFDARHFGISPREAETMDPRQRLTLKWAWEALESAGYPPSETRSWHTAVFVGIENNEFSEYLDPADPFFGTSTGPTMVANRISYHFDWHGPSEITDSACCGSLVAVHRAIRALQSGEAETALAGGVSLIYSPTNTIEGVAAGMLSPKGCTRAFDREAEGWVIGEGGGLVLLKPLARAIADRDPILGVIRGSAANHGGRVSSLTAPNPERMRSAATTALARAGIDPGTVTFVEAHGVGGELVDAAEMSGLMRAYRAPTDPGHCVLGSLTPNIGNLDPASGIAGLIKILLCMQARTLPPQIGYAEPNPHVDLDDSPFRIEREARDWSPTDAAGTPIPRRAGLHSYSWGGTNVHLVVEQAPPETSSPTQDGPRLAVFSARNESLLRNQVASMLAFLKRRPEVDPTALCATLQLGREAMPARLACLARSTSELTGKLETWMGGEVRPPKCWSGTIPDGRPKAAMIGDTPACRTYVAELFRGGFLAKVAALWVDGATIPWLALYDNRRPRLLRLPTYPFETRFCPFLPRTGARRRGPAHDRDQLAAWLEAVATGELNPDDLLDRLAPPMPATERAQPIEAESAEPSDARHTDGDPLIHCLRHTLAGVLHLEPDELTDEADLRRFGVDSLTGMAFMKELQQRFGPAIPMSLLLEHHCLRDLAQALWSDHAEPIRRGLNGERTAPRAWSPLVAIQSGGNRPATFWVHGAIGDVSWLIGVAHGLGPDFPIFGLEPRGLEGQEPHGSVAEMAACYLDAIREVQPQGPYHLGGYSGGGIVVLEMVRQLQARNEEVGRIFIGDTFMRGSDYYEDATVKLLENLDLEAVQLTALANVFAGLAGAEEIVSYPRLEALDRDARIDLVAHHLVDHTNAPRTLEETRAWIERNLEVGRALAHALTDYDPQPLDFVNRTSFFFCAEGYISADSKSRIPIATPRLDHVDHWRRVVPGEVDVVEVPCDHFALMHQPHVTKVIEHVKATLV
ncbi:Ketoacyl-synthetase C-terminal extension [Sulfidibacter corallicola]|uniref:Uncharacterized protein n=1 Tax=Sulfidibacter corallicola TaxID=2818388 RepID=A0A8A4TVF9_SULCO|nr:beta-ketoacyl synthase N-terminal-like domain-containing protein [Sulfidibacter corallicola]QTD50515.1 hypothetical protein J3U87_33440 [Sulfidibacter corallicola]